MNSIEYPSCLVKETFVAAAILNGGDSGYGRNCAGWFDRRCPTHSLAKVEQAYSRFSAADAVNGGTSCQPDFILEQESADTGV
jgi:hypothetical protein